MNEQALQNTLLAAIANGATWTLRDLAQRCGSCEERVRKSLARLQEIGLNLELDDSNDAQVGVRLAQPFEPLDLLEAGCVSCRLHRWLGPAGQR